MGKIHKYWDFALTAVMVASVLIALGYLKVTIDTAPDAGTHAFANADGLGAEAPIEGRSVGIASTQTRRSNP